jgi:hypothetical protein
MKKLAICLVSNRPDVLRSRWLATLPKLDRLRDRFDVGFSFQLQWPITHDLVKELEKLGPVDLHPPHPGSPFNWYPYREAACENVDAEYYLSTDDDFKFGGTTPSGWSCADRYIDAIEWMDRHPSFGALAMKSFLGGASFGRDVVPAQREIFSMGSGILLRHIGTPWRFADPIFNVAGALDDLASVYSRIERGSFAARTFNVPVSRLPTKKVKRGSVHEAYDEDWIYKYGLGRTIRERYNDPSWTFDSWKLPKGLVNASSDL